MKVYAKRGLLVFIFALTVVLTGCLPSPYFQKDVAMPQFQWHYEMQPVFKVDIKDTAALYHLYFIIRHTEAYPFSNIWMSIYTKQPGDSSYQKSRIEIPLAEPSGKWLGRGMGEIWEQRMPITRNDDPMIFKKPGTYEFKFEQNMRVNPLPDVLQVGLRVEKIGYRKAT
jgi:gliding motility-associated lipoprotein GldH